MARKYTGPVSFGNLPIRRKIPPEDWPEYWPDVLEEIRQIRPLSETRCEQLLTAYLNFGVSYLMLTQKTMPLDDKGKVKLFDDIATALGTVSDGLETIGQYPNIEMDMWLKMKGWAWVQDDAPKLLAAMKIAIEQMSAEVADYSVSHEKHTGTTVFAACLRGMFEADGETPSLRPAGDNNESDFVKFFMAIHNKGFVNEPLLQFKPISAHDARQKLETSLRRFDSDPIPLPLLDEITG